MASFGPTSRTWKTLSASAFRFLCVSITPLGSLVVPEVYRSTARSSAELLTRESSGRLWLRISSRLLCDPPATESMTTISASARESTLPIASQTAFPTSMWASSTNKRRAPLSFSSFATWSGLKAVSKGTATHSAAMMPRYVATHLGPLLAKMAQRDPGAMPVCCNHAPRCSAIRRSSAYV